MVSGPASGVVGRLKKKNKKKKTTKSRFCRFSIADSDGLL